MIHQLLAYFLDSYLFSYFAVKFFSLKHKKFFLFTTILSQSFIYYIIGNSHFISAICIIGIMTLCIYIDKKKITYDGIYVIITFKVLMILCDMVGLLIKDILIFSTLITARHIAALFLGKYFPSLLLFIIIEIYFHQHNQIKLSLNYKKWHLVLFFEIILLLQLIIISHLIDTMGVSILLTCLLGLSLALFILFRYVLRELESLNQKEKDYEKNEQLLSFHYQKLALMKNLKLDIDSANHRLFYIIYQLEYYLSHQQIQKALKLVENYKQSVLHYDVIIDTENAVFDCLYSLRVNKLINSGVDVENTIFISQNKFYNDFNFINFINELLGYFGGCKTVKVMIQEINNNVVIQVIYQDGVIKEEALKSFLKKHISFCHMKYRWDDSKVKQLKILLISCL